MTLVLVYYLGFNAGLTQGYANLPSDHCTVQCAAFKRQPTTSSI